MNERNEINEIIPRSAYWSWGDATKVKEIPEGIWPYLTERCGVEKLDNPILHVEPENMRLPAEVLPENHLIALQKIVGDDAVFVSRDVLLEHAAGKSYPDAYRMRTGDATSAPHAVVEPNADEQVQQVLKYCVDNSIAVVPFGGGTSVVGGLETFKGAHEYVINVDLRRFNQLEKLDKVSGLATMGAGMRGPEMEAALNPEGFTLGHYPQSHQEATLGGYVTTRSAGQNSTGYGRSDDLVVGMRLVTPDGVYDLGNIAPGAANGPGVLPFVVGSEGAFGIVTSATMRLHRLPKEKLFSARIFPNVDSAAQALREAAQSLGKGALPTVCRVSDAEETFDYMVMAGNSGKRVLSYCRKRGYDTPCLAIFSWEGEHKSLMRYQQSTFLRVMGKFGGLRAPSMLAKKWLAGRFEGPYLRESLMQHKILVDTVETATYWDNLMNLYMSVQQAIVKAGEDEGCPLIVQCHLSHIYETGASLYFTFLGKEADDPVKQWERVKDYVGVAIVECGATISHHHSVGSYHRKFVGAEIKPLGTRIVTAVKQELDPTGILNPEKLIPDTE